MIMENEPQSGLGTAETTAPELTDAQKERLDKIDASTTIEQVYALVPSDEPDEIITNAAFKRCEEIRHEENETVDETDEIDPDKFQIDPYDYKDVEDKEKGENLVNASALPKHTKDDMLNQIHTGQLKPPYIDVYRRMQKLDGTRVQYRPGIDGL